MVFQNYALYPHMSVRENLGYALKVAKVPKTEIAQRVDDVAKMLGLVELMDRRPAALSGGQRQRVAMGRAIVRRPSAYLMDEPLSNLDAKLRVSMRAELANLHERLGVTTIYVTHDQVEAMTLGQRVAVINEGVIQQVDTPQNLYRNPANLFVAGFIGSPSMNLVEATVADGTLVIGQFAVPLHETHRSLLQGRGRVVVGVRPDSFEDSLWSESDLPRIQVEVSVVEELGAEAHVFFPVDAPRIDTGSSGDDSEDALLAESAGRSRFVARVDSRSTIRPGARVSLTIDPSRFHFFDVGTGQSLRAETPAPVG
jgi:multiple sugar transport system ATP-binding protein